MVRNYEKKFYLTKSKIPTFTVNAAAVSHIAFMKDANFKPKCPLAVETDPLQKPLVLLRLSQSSLDSTNVELAEKEADTDVDEENEDEIEEEPHPNGYTLVELNKAQLQKLITSSKLQLVEKPDTSSYIGMIQVHNEDADDWDDDERSKKRPWRKIQRIIRRQLIKKPKRYFKKIAHQIG